MSDVRSVLLFATTTGYQTRSFEEAAARAGVRLRLATDRCLTLDDPWRDQAIPVRFHDMKGSLRAVLRAVDRDEVAGVLVVGDQPVVLAAAVAHRLGLRGHPVDAAEASRNKHLARLRWRAAGLPSPAFHVFPLEQAEAAIPSLPLPCVVKPLVLSGSRGVIRADTPGQLREAIARVARLLRAPDVRVRRDPEAGRILVEEYVPGDEYAVEALLDGGRLVPIAIFEKPDPLVGPFFEETIYITPARISREKARSIEDAVEAAARALGLTHGPVHAECRVDASRIVVHEVAARPIGGLCARALSFTLHGRRASFEDLLLHHAMGGSPAGWSREEAASGVMMIPIPAGGVYRGVDGIDEARQVAGIDDIVITAKPEQMLVPLPEGASYLGFIFARGASPDAVETSLRGAHGRLRFSVDRALPLAPAAGGVGSDEAIGMNFS